MDKMATAALWFQNVRLRGLSGPRDGWDQPSHLRQESCQLAIITHGDGYEIMY